jgi:hypothetical protein
MTMSPNTTSHPTDFGASLANVSAAASGRAAGNDNGAAHVILYVVARQRAARLLARTPLAGLHTAVRRRAGRGRAVRLAGFANANLRIGESAGEATARGIAGLSCAALRRAACATAACASGHDAARRLTAGGLVGACARATSVVASSATALRACAAGAPTRRRIQIRVVRFAACHEARKYGGDHHVEFSSPVHCIRSMYIEPIAGRTALAVARHVRPHQ